MLFQKYKTEKNNFNEDISVRKAQVCMIKLMMAEFDLAASGTVHAGSLGHFNKTVIRCT